MDSTAIDRIGQLAIEAQKANRLDTDTPAFINDSGHVVPLEHLQARRSRFRGKFETSVLSEFAQYVKANLGGAGFIDPKSAVAKVFFNLGDPGLPGHGDWTGQLKLDPTAAFSAIRAAEGQRFTQRQLAEWVEDWSPNLRALIDGAEVSITAAVAAIRSLTISAKSDVTHTDKDFGASRTALEDIEAKAAGGMPTHLIFRTEPYLGFQQRDFLLRVSVITGEKPALSLRIVSKEAVIEDIDREFRALLLDSIGDAATLTIGTFTP